MPLPYWLQSLNRNVNTILGGVRNLLQVQEVRCQGDVSHLAVVKDLDFDSVS